MRLPNGWLHVDSSGVVTDVDEKALLQHVCEMKTTTAAVRAETGTLKPNGVGLQAMWLTLERLAAEMHEVMCFNHLTSRVAR